MADFGSGKKSLGFSAADMCMCAILNEEGKSKWYWIAEQLAAGGNFEGVVCKSYNTLTRLVHIIGRHFFLIELGGRTCFMPFFWDSDFFLLWQLSVFSDNWYIYIYIATLIPLAWCLSLQKAFWVSNPCFWIVTKKQSSRKMSDWSRGMEDSDLVLRWMLSNNLSGSWWNLNMVFLLTIHSWFQLSTFTPACMHLNAVWILLQFSLIRHFNCWTTCREGGKHIGCAWWAWSCECGPMLHWTRYAPYDDEVLYCADDISGLGVWVLQSWMF